MKHKKCVYCKSKDTEDLQDECPLEVKGKTILVFLWIRKCKTCDTEYVPKDLILKNDAIVEKAKTDYLKTNQVG